MTQLATPESSAADRILEACRWEIAESGARGLRVQRVAKRAGVSLGLVYYHFTDRAGLLHALLEAVNAAAISRGEEPGGEVSFDRVLRVLAEEIDDAPEVRANSVVWNEIRAISVFEPELQDLLAVSTRRWNESIGELLVADGVPEEEAADRAVLLTALVEGISSRWLSAQIDTATARRLLTRGAGALRTGADACPDGNFEDGKDAS